MICGLDKAMGGGGVSARAHLHTPPLFGGLGLNRMTQGG